MLSGPSGGGKSTIAREVMANHPDFVFSVSSTTRPPRPHEVEGREYHFLSRPEFERRINAGEFLEWIEVHGELYGTEKKAINRLLHAGKRVLLDVDVLGGEAVRRLYPEAKLIFLYPPSMDVLRERLVRRGTDSPEQIAKRLSRYPMEREHGYNYPFQVVNDDLEQAVLDVLCIIEEVEDD